MKKLLYLIPISLSFLIPISASAQGIVLQTNNCYAGSCAFGSNLSAGSTIIVFVSTITNPSGGTVSDSAGNTFTDTGLNTCSDTGSSPVCADIWTAPVTVTGADTISWTDTGDPGMNITEVAGLVTGPVIDVSDKASKIGTDANPSSDTITTTNSTDFIYSGLGQETEVNSCTSGSGFTFLGQNGNHYDGEQYAAGLAPSSYTSTFNCSSGYSDWVVVSAAFKETGSAPPPTNFNQFKVSLHNLFQVVKGTLFKIN